MKKLMLVTALVGATMLPLTASAAVGAYVEAQGGYTKLDTNKNINATDNNIGHFSYGARAGIAKNVSDDLKLGAELGLTDLGESKFDTVATISQKSLDLLATASLTVNPQVDVFVKGGIANVRQEAELATSTVKTTKIKPMAAFGVAYDLNEQVALTGTVQHIFGDELNSGNFTTDTIASSTAANVGVRYNF